MRRTFVMLVPLLLVVAACGKDDGAGVQSASETGGASGSTTSTTCEVKGGVDDAKTDEVHLTLAEFTITAEEKSTSAGVVQVEGANKGAEKHEIVVARGPKADLPVTDGVVDEDKADIVGEIEPFDSGKECVGKFGFAAGTYTLFCGIVEEDEGASHFQQGMVTELEVK